MVIVFCLQNSHKYIENKLKPQQMTADTLSLIVTGAQVRVDILHAVE